MNELDSRRKALGGFAAASADRARRRQRDDGTEALAAGFDEIAGQIRDGCDRAGGALVKQALDSRKLAVELPGQPIERGTGRPGRLHLGLSGQSLSPCFAN